MKARIAALFSRSGIAGTRSAGAVVPSDSLRAQGSGASSAAHLAVLLALSLTAMLAFAGSALAAAPSVSIEPATNVGYSVADVEGEVDPADNETYYCFEVTAEAPVWSGFCFEGPLAANSGSTPLAKELTGLNPGTEYTVRLTAFNFLDPEVFSEEKTFTTEGPVSAPAVSGVEASNVRFTTAIVKGDVEIEDADPAFYASCAFRYITDTAFRKNQDEELDPFAGAKTAPCSEEATAAGSNPVEAQLTGLSANTTYHLRLEASNQAGSDAATGPNVETEAVKKPIPGTPVISAITSSSAHLEAEINPNAPDENAALDDAEKAAYATTWSITCQPACSGPKETIDADDEAIGVEGEVEGPLDFVFNTPTDLEPNTKYTLTLHAKNAGGERTSTQTFTTAAVPPEAFAGSNTPQSDTSVYVYAYVNAHNSPLTECTFHYGTDSTYGQTEPCDTPPASTNKAIVVATTITGLEPGATYHAKVSVATAAGSDEGGDQVLSAFQSPDESACDNAGKPGAGFLPDCRAWEMVSPPDKNGGDVAGNSTQTRAALSGDAVAFTSRVVFADARGSGQSADYISRRDGVSGTQGWSTHSISPFQEPPSFSDAVFLGTVNPNYLLLSPDLSTGIFISPTPLTSGSPNVDGITNLYLRDDMLQPGAGHYTILNDCLAPPDGPCSEPLPLDPSPQGGVAGTSTDLGQVIFESIWNLTDDASGGLPKLYEWDHGTVRLAGILPDGGPAPSSAAGRGAGARGQHGYTRNTISEDGSRVLFTSPVNSQSVGTATASLYLRENHATTVHVNESENPSSGEPEPATFRAASSDLSKIFFTSGEDLTGDGSGGLYLYDASLPASDPHNLTRIALDEEPDDAGGVTDVIGASQDGDYLYFLANGQLVDDGEPGITRQPCGQNRKCMFVWHDGTVHFVTGLDPYIGSDNTLLTGFGAWSVGLTQSARIADDGTKLAFVAQGIARQQPAYDNGSQCDGASGIVPFYGGNSSNCAEVYLYNATAADDAGRLVCASCNRAGTHTSATDANINFRIGNATQTSNLNRALSDDGRYVFFSTGERLVSEDTNGRFDAYVYDTRTGRQSLISSGTDAADSFFMDASADGSDAFFVTRQRLSAWDVDSGYDLYDARVDGGFPEPVTPVECADDTCQGPQAASPPVPPTVTDAVTAPSQRAVNRRHRKKKGKHRKHRQRGANDSRRADR